MGFRYISVEGIEERDIQVSARALYSDLERIGEFACSNDMINQLQSNIIWGAKSNLVDIPTDCPQRDERMGWTGDIAVFSPTACYLFDMSRFLGKWMLDVKAEQFPGGGLPNTVPRHSYGFPATMPDMAVDWAVRRNWVFRVPSGFRISACLTVTVWPFFPLIVRSTTPAKFWPKS